MLGLPLRLRRQLGMSSAVSALRPACAAALLGCSSSCCQDLACAPTAAWWWHHAARPTAAWRWHHAARWRGAQVLCRCGAAVPAVCSCCWSVSGTEWRPVNAPSGDRLAGRGHFDLAAKAAAVLARAKSCCSACGGGLRHTGLRSADPRAGAGCQGCAALGRPCAGGHGRTAGCRGQAGLCSGGPGRRPARGYALRIRGPPGAGGAGGRGCRAGRSAS